METFLGLHNDYNVIADTTAPFKVPCLFLSPNITLLFGWYTSVSFFCVFMDTHMYKNIRYYLWPIMGVIVSLAICRLMGLWEIPHLSGIKTLSQRKLPWHLPLTSHPPLFFLEYLPLPYKFVYSITAYLLPLEGKPPHRQSVEWFAWRK